MAIWEGAKKKYGDETDEVTWEARDSVWVRDSEVVAFYDHTLMMRNGRLINVMGTFEEIAKKMRIPVGGKMVAKKKLDARIDEARVAAEKILDEALTQAEAYEQGVSGND